MKLGEAQIVNLENLMLSKGYDQQRLAGAVGISPSTISRLFTGKKNVEKATFLRVVAWLGQQPTVVAKELLPS